MYRDPSGHAAIPLQREFEIAFFIFLLSELARQSISDKITDRVVTYAGNIDLNMPSTGNFSVSVSDLKGFDGIYFNEGDDKRTGETEETSFDKQKKGTPGNNQAQNKQFRDVVKKLKLNKEQQRELHDEITGQNYGYQEILETAKDMFGK